MFIFLVSLVLTVFLKANLVDAALSRGWGWGGSEDATFSGKTLGSVDGNETGVGWISTNNADSGSGSSFTYNVNIPAIDGPVLGYGWIGNLDSYIDFAPHMGCPTEKYAGQCNAYPTNGGQQTDVMRIGSSLKGWARIVGISKSNAIGNSGGEDGWISFDPGTGGFGVTIASDGALSGYAWAGSTLGSISFTGVTIPVPPVVTVDAKSELYLEPTQTFANTPQIVNVSWTITPNPVNSCTRTCTNASGALINCNNWSNNTSTVDGNVDVTMPQTEVTFKLTCVDTDGQSGSGQVTVRVGCKPGTCELSNETCAMHSGTFYPVINGSDPVCMGGCLSDTECMMRQGSNWREVAP